MVMGKMTLEEVRAAAKELTPEEREILSADLARTKKTLPEIQAAWIAESERRLDAFEAGREKAYPAEEVFARYKR
jgi:putative addiction module component (TIGR02574 family)